jgi:AcrR family transcriptional regulator
VLAGRRQRSSGWTDAGAWWSREFEPNPVRVLCHDTKITKRTVSFGYDSPVRSTSELRDVIIDAARAEFARYGLAGARIDRIAKSAHASKERLYAHFGDKEALFRQVVAADSAEFFGAVAVRPDAVAEFAGDIYDLATTMPEHLRMITWARLEGVPLDEPDLGGRKILERDAASIEAAQAAGHIDRRWEPEQLIIVLFGIGMAWAGWPQEHPGGAQTRAISRAVAVEAATRVLLPRPATPPD